MQSGTQAPSGRTSRLTRNTEGVLGQGPHPRWERTTRSLGNHWDFTRVSIVSFRALLLNAAVALFYGFLQLLKMHFTALFIYKIQHSSRCASSGKNVLLARL